MSENHPAPISNRESHVPVSGAGDFQYRMGPADPAAFEEEGGSFSIRKTLEDLYRYKWIVVAAAIVGVGAGYVAWHQAEPEYTAQGSLWIRSGDSSDSGPIVSENLLPAGSWVDLLKSFQVIDPVVQDLRLYIDPENFTDLEALWDLRVEEFLTGGTYLLRVADDGSAADLVYDDLVVDRAPLGSPIGTAQGIRWTVPRTLQPAEEIAFRLSLPRNVANRLQQQVLAQDDAQGNFILVTLTGRDPERVANTVNAMMDNHVVLATELKRGALDDTHRMLTQQLDTATMQLAEAEQALREFQVNTITLPSEETGAIQPGIEATQGLVTNQFFEMRQREEDLRRTLARLRDAAATMSTSGGVPLQAFQMIPALNDAPQLRAAVDELVSAEAEMEVLGERYLPDHPAMQQLSERIRNLETSRIPSLLAQFIQTMEVEHQILEDRIASSESDLRQIPIRSIQESRLRRNVAIQVDFYTNVQNRYQFTNIARASSQPDVQILDRAIPPNYPAVDPRSSTAVAAFMVFLAAGIGVAVLLGKFDSRLRTPDEVQSAFGLTMLGAIPRIRGGGRLEGPESMQNLTQVHEAFRELRTNLTFAYGSAGPLVLTITSSGMDEGKTTITTNLGVAFAELGNRVLVIDADTRRGDLHHFVGGFRKPGLTDYLRGTASAADVLQGANHPNMDIIASGTQVANSPELVSSAEMTRMLAALRRRYDVILVDSPPLGAGADPLVLATLTGHLLLVIRAGSTGREFTQAKLEPLERLPIRLLGVVLNDYEPSRISGDRYTYYSSYLPGYAAGAEEDGSTHPQLAVGAGAGPGRFGEEELDSE